MKDTNTRREKTWWKKLPQGKIYRLPDGDIICADALVFLRSLRERCADIIFLDPPFNLGKSYAKSNRERDRMDESEYLNYISKVIMRSVEILKDGGAMFLYHLPRWAVTFSTIMQEKLEFRHWIAIAMKNNIVRPKHLYPAHYALLYYTKGKPTYFRRPKLPISTCRHCGRHIKDYGGYKQYMKNGVNLSDVWDDLSPVRHRNIKARDANELPLEIPLRALTITGQHGSLMVDPFAGSGTTVVAARKLSMQFVACDREPEYCDLMKARVDNWKYEETTLNR